MHKMQFQRSTANMLQVTDTRFAKALMSASLTYRFESPLERGSTPR